MKIRQVTGLVRGQAASDGAGVKLSRVIGNGQLPMLDPFLMLDEFRSDEAGDYIAGFPDHPHRGFETVTYMLAGRMRHHDNQGNSGLLEAGSVQWMTAGRGIVHSEMPEQEDGLMWGFQLWVNLPARDKMMPPRYQDIRPEQVPEVAFDGGKVRVVAGEFAGVAGPVEGIVTAPLYLDVRLDAGGQFATAVPAGHHAFAYVYQGGAVIAGKPVARGQLAVLGEGDRVEAAAGDEPASLILVAAQPLREPVARYGPFVMNTQAEIHQAFADFREGRF
ncbi:MAG TPA: pirin family protein [Fluviicoccus sp.]|nr:pirin family protein [Fluviicoccus sp.]